ncbi:MAG: 2,5-diketo-D-gluconate reductase A [Candidatus Aldehydirespiratoraceae bacterium]|jgi:2,5-diketo-D-gluconate reductase A
MDLPLGPHLTMPQVGFGTYLIDDAAVEGAVLRALRAGYRHIDTAEAYRNEPGVGRAIGQAISDGAIARDDVFVTTKLWPGNPQWGDASKDYASTIRSFDTSLGLLGLDHLDLYLIHAPFGGENRVEQWRALVDLRESGKVRAIGVSNFTQAHIEELTNAGLAMPDANQIELHPWSQKPELVGYLQSSSITTIAYSSLVPLSTWRIDPGQDSAKTDEMRAATESPFRSQAKKYGVTEAQFLLRWAVQQGFGVLPKTTNASRLTQNLDLHGFEIDSEDMAEIATMDRGEGLAWATGDPTQTT